MECITVKEGVVCFFMGKKGCEYNGGTCQPIIAKCEGCQKTAEYPTGKYCNVSPAPESKWRNGNCNMATHIEKEVKKQTQKVNPIKASKRGGR